MKTVRTKVLKSTIFFNKRLRDYLDTQALPENLSGIRAALEFARAVEEVCFTGVPLWACWVSGKDTSSLPSALHPLRNLFLPGFQENTHLMSLVASSRRVEILIQFHTESSIDVTATFYESGRTILGYETAIYDFNTGAYLNSCRSFKNSSDKG